MTSQVSAENVFFIIHKTSVCHGIVADPCNLQRGILPPGWVQVHSPLALTISSFSKTHNETRLVDTRHITAHLLDHRLPSFPGSWHSSALPKLQHPGRVQHSPILQQSKTQQQATRTTQALVIRGAASVLPIDLQHPAIPVGTHTRNRHSLKR